MGNASCESGSGNDVLTCTMLSGALLSGTLLPRALQWLRVVGSHAGS